MLTQVSNRPGSSHLTWRLYILTDKVFVFDLILILGKEKQSTAWTQTTDLSQVRSGHGSH